MTISNLLYCYYIDYKETKSEKKIIVDKYSYKWRKLDFIKNNTQELNFNNIILHYDTYKTKILPNEDNYILC